jgi:hypothetical protein
VIVPQQPSQTHERWGRAVGGRITTGAESSAETGSATVMITLQADFNHMDAQGRLRLDDLRMHGETPFAEIAAKHASITSSMVTTWFAAN